MLILLAESKLEVTEKVQADKGLDLHFPKSSQIKIPDHDRIPAILGVAGDPYGRIGAG